jgi:hypothetical protein
MKKIKILLLSVLFLYVFNTADAAESSDTKNVSLQVNGNKTSGFYVTILASKTAINNQSKCGEFSAWFQNAEASVKDAVENWKATEWKGNSSHVELTGKVELKYVVDLYITVIYDIINEHVVRKRIDFYQADMPVIFLKITNRIEPTAAPENYWSFDQPDCKGGYLRDLFPAIGYRTSDGLTIGLLADAGFRNHYTRIFRRRPEINTEGGLTDLKELPDARLFEICLPKERAIGNNYISQTFGEILYKDETSTQGQPTEIRENFKIFGQCQATVKNGKFHVTGAAEQKGHGGISLPIIFDEEGFYTIRFKYRSSDKLATRLWMMDKNRDVLKELALTFDAIPESKEWAVFEKDFCIVNAASCPIELFITRDWNNKTGKYDFEFKNLEIRRNKTASKPFDRLTIGQKLEKTVFIFVDDKLKNTMHDLRLASQIYLAEGLGFKGGQTEKVFYATLMSLMWITEPFDFQPHAVPSIYYAPDMYNRDSAYSLWACYNRELNEKIFLRWGDSQGPDGAISTIITPQMGAIEKKSNEATPEWLMWAMLNKRRYNTTLPMERIVKAAQYCMDTFDPDRDGICRAKFVMGMNDIVDYPEWTEELAINQGVWAVTLRVIKELNIPQISETISEQYIEKAEQAYRSYYNPDKKLFCPKHSIDDVICLDTFHPEYMSLWLFGRKILTDEMVVNTLEKTPMFWPREDAPFAEEGKKGVIAPITIWLKKDAPNGWSYFTDKYYPVMNIEFGKTYADHACDGMYYNGGSWFRPEILAYAAGKMHGWKKADARIANRLWAEINLCENFPTSQEYLATTEINKDKCYHRVFCWNVFALQALEMIGQRTPQMDPDYTAGK